MNAKDLLNNQIEIVECAKVFRKDANNLMLELSKDFNFSLESTKSFGEVYNHKYNNKGIFRKEWTYYFHGSDCRFDNLNIGQIVEFTILKKPEFGFLNGYYFYAYMASTEKFKQLAHWFENYLNVWEAIEILADNEILKKVPSEELKEYIIAL